MKDSTGKKYLDSEFYRAYRLCKRLVWLGWHSADGILENPWENKALLSLAKNLFPNAIDVFEHCSCLEEALDETKRLLRTGKTVINGCFSSSIGMATVDIIVPLNEDCKESIFVCPARGVHPLFIEKIAYTTTALIKNGVEPGRISLLRVNPNYKKTTALDPRQYFVKQVITARVASRVKEVDDTVSEIFKIIRLPHPPEQIYDKWCYDPLICPFFENCWRILPDQNIIFLYRGGKKIKKLLSAGVFDLTQIPDEIPLTDKQKIQVIAAKSGEPFINKRAIKLFLKKLKYPLHFLDFETVSAPIPLFLNTRPFETIPYEFSLNIQETPGSEVKTVNYIAETNLDPREEILKILSREISEAGSVVAYNAPFELTCLRECVRVCPDYSSWLDNIANRMVDLLKPFKSLDYYHPDQRGSASLKVVLPCLTGISYKNLAIKNGDQAAEQYLKLMSGAVSAEEAAIIKRQLEEYCYTDSIGMLWIIEALKKLVD